MGPRTTHRQVEEQMHVAADVLVDSGFNVTDRTAPQAVVKVVGYTRAYGMKSADEKGEGSPQVG